MDNGLNGSAEGLVEPRVYAASVVVGAMIASYSTGGAVCLGVVVVVCGGRSLRSMRRSPVVALGGWSSVAGRGRSSAGARRMTP